MTAARTGGPGPTGIDLEPGRSAAVVEVAGLVRLGLIDPTAAELRLVGRRVDPYPLVAATEAGAATADVVVELDRTGRHDRPGPVLEQLGDIGDGLVTAWDGERVHLQFGKGSCTLPAPADRPRHFVVRGDLPLWWILGPFVGPALQDALAERGAVVAHGSAVVVPGMHGNHEDSAILLAGWSESGKTEVALALATAGLPLLADKWAVLGPDGTVAPFPAPLTIRRWLLTELPELRSALAPVTRFRFRLAGSIGPLADAIRSRTGAGPASGVALAALRRSLELADRTSLEPGRLRHLGLAVADEPARPRRLGAVAMLTAMPPSGDALPTECGADPSPHPVVDPAGSAWAAARLAASATAERRAWDGVRARADYASIPREPTVIDGDAALRSPDGRRRTGGAAPERFERLIASVPILDVRAPFPGSTGPTATAILRALADLPRKPTAATGRPPRRRGFPSGRLPEPAGRTGSAVGSKVSP